MEMDCCEVIYGPPATFQGYEIELEIDESVGGAYKYIAVHLHLASVSLGVANASMSRD